MSHEVTIDKRTMWLETQLLSTILYLFAFESIFRSCTNQTGYVRPGHSDKPRPRNKPVASVDKYAEKIQST